MLNFPCGSVGKNLADSAGDMGSILGSRRSPGVENDNPLVGWFLPWKSHAQRSLTGYSPQVCKESDMTEWLDNNNILKIILSILFYDWFILLIISMKWVLLLLVSVVWSFDWRVVFYYMNITPFLNHSPIDRLMHCFQYLAFMTKDTMKYIVQIFWSTYPLLFLG